MTVLERTHFFPRQIVTADDLTQDQEYFREKLRRHNRFLHGWGVVCGLEVTPDPIQLAPWRIQIGAGYALDPWGNDIHVAEPIQLNLAVFGPGAETDPCALSAIRIKKPIQGLTAPSQLYLVIQYAECNTSPVRVMTNGCGSGDNACEYSRQRDSFQIKCLSDLPASHQTPIGPSIYPDAFPPYLSPPPDAYILLARITLPTQSSTQINPATQISKGNIEMALRRQIYTTATPLSFYYGGEPLQKQEVLRVVLMAVNWQTHASEIFSSPNIPVMATVAGGRFNISAFNPSNAELSVLLDAAGLPPDDDGIRFRPSMLVTAGDDQMIEFATKLAADLGQIGIAVTLELVSAEQMGVRFAEKVLKAEPTLALSR